MTSDAVAVGVDFGGTKMLGAVVDSKGVVLAEHRVPTPYESDALLDVMAGLVRTLEEKVGRPVTGVGVGAAGLVDRDGNLRFSPNVGGLTDVAIQSGVAARLPGQIVRVDNDANAATWGECLFGAGARTREMALITLGTGIGGGLVSGGRLFKGKNGFAAEFGHITVSANGELCACGNLGCWEAYASGRALGRLGREAAASGALEKALELAGGRPEDIRGEHVTQAARLGDRAARAVVDEFAWWLAVGAASLVAMLDPEVLVVGGGLAEQADLFIDAAQQHLDEMSFGRGNRPPVPLVVATLGEKAGVVGAAMLVHGDEIPEY